MRLPSIIALGLLAAACGAEESASTNGATRDIAVRSDEQNQLHQLSDQLRDIALKRAILASGLRCKRVVRSGYVSE